MHCYFNLVSPQESIIDEEGIAVADADEARTFAREAILEMVQDGVAEIAHWRGWEIEARDASGPSYYYSCIYTAGMVLSWASLGGEERRCLLRFGRARWSPGTANGWRSR